MSKQVFQSTPPFIEIRCSEPVPFYFARRKGKDSIAVLLYDFDKDSFLIRMQPLVHLDDGDSKKLFPCPITGSLDDGENPMAAALREVKEEAGYSLAPSALRYMGSYIVGTQTDEVVHLYFADVTGMPTEAAAQDGTFHESISKNIWLSTDQVGRVVSAECYSGLIVAYYRSVSLIKSLAALRR